MKKIDNKYGRLNILINNAGTTRYIEHNQLNDLTADFFDEIYKIHLRGPYICVQQSLPLLKKSKDSLVVNIASIAALTAVGSNIAYCAMKAGLISYTQTLAERLGPYSINVNCVCPGNVWTEVWKGISKRTVETIPEYKGQDAREWFDGIAKGKYPDMFTSTSLRKNPTIEDISRCVVFLVTEDAKNITGQSVSVDGGRSKN